MVLHYAHLCAAAGGVDAFLIGSELRGLCACARRATAYPAVGRAENAGGRRARRPRRRQPRSATPPTGRYNNHQTGDAPGAVQFHLDPLWADANIDFVGIDNYLPLADWRDGTAHLDYDAATAPSTHDPDYLTANIRGGEDYDWYYASDADRAAQLRTPITDGAYAKPWVFRAKDFWNWWANAHYDRADGSESGDADRLGAGMKPDLVHRTGLPRGRQGRQPAQRLRRSEIEREFSAVFLQRRARRPDPAPVSRGAPEFLGRRRQQPDFGRVCGADGRHRQYLCVDVGRAAVPVLSLARRYLGRRRKLPAGPLAERPAGRRDRSPIW